MDIRNHIKSLVLVVLLLTCSLASSHAWAGTIRGVVTSFEYGEPLAGVTVSLVEDPGPAGRWKATAATDSVGNYIFDDLASGRWELFFATPGFTAAADTVEISTNDTLVVDISLKLDAIQIGDLVVTGRAADAEAELQTGFVNLDSATLRKIPNVIEPDPLRALQILPGVQAASDISSGLYIRGGGPDQTLVLADGITVYNPTHAFGFFSTFNNDVVRDVDLYKGAYPAKYGGRLGAVLDVGMKENTTPKVSGKLGISLIAARGLIEGRAGPDQWYLAGRRSWLDPLLNALRTDENPIPDYFFYDVNARYVSDRWGGRTTFSWYRGKDDVGVEADAYTAFDLGWGNDVLMLRHQRDLSADLDMEATLSRSKYEAMTDASIFATPFEVTNELQDISLSGALNYRAGEAHRLTLGLLGSWYDFLYQQTFNLSPGVDYRSKPTELATYLEDRWVPGEKTVVRGGVRVRYITDGDRLFAEPRLSISHRIRPDLRLKLGGGVYNQYLQLVTTEGFSAGDFYLPIDETADPGRSWQAVIGAEWNVSDHDLLSLDVYNNDMQNLVEFDNRTPVDQNEFTAENIFVTGGTGYARGAEVFFRHQKDKFTGWLGYTLGYTERQFEELNAGDPFPPKYDRRHDINVLVGYEAGKWSLSASFRYATGQAFTPASGRYQIQDPPTGETLTDGQILPGARNSGRLASYHRLDVSARRPIRIFGAPAELVLEIFNLYNRRNEWFVQYDTEGEVTEVDVIKMLPLIPSVGVNIAF